MMSESVLEDYFCFLAAGSYTKAKRIIENISSFNKYESKSHLVKLYNGFLAVLNLERKYYSMEFLISKRKSLFSRKENHSETYSDLLSKIEAIDVDKSTDMANVEVARMAKSSLCQICDVRSRMTEMYNDISQLGKNDDHRSIVDLIDIVRPLGDYLKQLISTNRSSQRSMMAPVLDVIELEIDVLVCLAEAQQLMSNLYFLVPINLLHSANEKCQQLLQAYSYETKSTRLFSRHSQSLHLLSWLMDLYNVSLAKYTLYFHPILMQKMTLLPLNTIAPHEGRAFELVQRITTFVKKASVSSFLLVFDSTKQNLPFLGHGYVLPANPEGRTSGVQSYPVIFSFPTNSDLLSHQLHCAIVMLIGRMEKSSHHDDFVDYLAEPGGHRTYFLARVDYRVYLILIFEERRDREKLIINFIDSFRTDLNAKLVIDQLTTISS